MVSHPVTDFGPPTVDPQRGKCNYENEPGWQDSSFVEQTSQADHLV